MVRFIRWRRVADQWTVRLALMWAGVSIGVAFVATPAKFLAPTLSLPVALDVGRQTFRVYNGLELVLAALAIGLALASMDRWRHVRRVVAPAGIVVLQALWLIPSLDAYTQSVQAGQSPPGSHLHAVYIAAEILKIATLVWAALASTPERSGVPPTGHRWVKIVPQEQSPLSAAR